LFDSKRTEAENIGQIWNFLLLYKLVEWWGQWCVNTSSAAYSTISGFWRWAAAPGCRLNTFHGQFFGVGAK